MLQFDLSENLRLASWLIPAYGWPADPVHHASFGEAVGDAMKMDAEMRRMRQEEDARRGN